MITLISLVVLSVVPFLFREQWLRFVGNFLVVNDTLAPADVIHVIAGDDYRTDYAIELYQQGYGKTLFFTGGWCDIHLYWHGVHAHERSLAQGVRPEAVAFDEAKVTSTYMEAERLKEWIARHPSPVESIIVVSDPFHMRRTRWIYKKVFGDTLQIRMAPVPFERTPYQPSWWKDRQSRAYVKEEYFKFIYYIFRYQYSCGPFRKWLISLDAE